MQTVMPALLEVFATAESSLTETAVDILTQASPLPVAHSLLQCCPAPEFDRSYFTLRYLCHHFRPFRSERL